jgi:hypothetical protein
MKYQFATRDHALQDWETTEEAERRSNFEMNVEEYEAYMKENGPIEYPEPYKSISELLGPCAELERYKVVKRIHDGHYLCLDGGDFDKVIILLIGDSNSGFGAYFANSSLKQYYQSEALYQEYQHTCEKNADINGGGFSFEGTTPDLIISFLKRLIEIDYPAFKESWWKTMVECDLEQKMVEGLEKIENQFHKDEIEFSTPVDPLEGEG